MEICLTEIARCQRLSPRPNFIVLLGDRYGWQPIPDKIPSSEMEQLCKYFGSSGFSVGEFKPPLTIEKLCKAIVDDNYDISIQAPIKTINWLNELLTVPNFYDILRTKKPDISFSENITDLVDKTNEYRNKSFSTLNDEQDIIQKDLTVLF